jgi:peroxiredoxin
LISRSPAIDIPPELDKMRGSQTNPNIMAIAPGTKAPEFTLKTITASGPADYSLSANLGKKNTVILFFPLAFTGVCTQELCEISGGLNEFQALNARVLAISGDNPFAQKAWADQENITVTLLSDYDHSVARAYGIAYDSFLPDKNLGQAGVPKRSAFVIDKDGVVQYAEAHDNPGELPDFAAIKSVLAGLV